MYAMLVLRQPPLRTSDTCCWRGLLTSRLLDEVEQLRDAGVMIESLNNRTPRVLSLGCESKRVAKHSTEPVGKCEIIPKRNEYSIRLIHDLEERARCGRNDDTTRRHRLEK